MKNDLILQVLEESDRDLDWLQENIETLKEEYDQKFIAIKNQKIIAFGTRMEDVVKNLKVQGTDPKDVLLYSISKIALVL